jgi:hypothetical protein
VDDRRAAADDVVGRRGVDAQPAVLGLQGAAVAVDLQAVRQVPGDRLDEPDVALQERPPGPVHVQGRE